MVADNILFQFGKFVTVENFDTMMGEAVDDRVERALAPFGEMLAELEGKISGIDLEGAEIVTLIQNQTWVKPPGFNRFHIICIGAGGGGGTGSYDILFGNSYGGTGAGGGGCNERTFTAEEMPSEVVCTLGVAGVGAVNGGSGAKRGADGTATTFGTLLTAGGGQGGGFNNASTGGLGGTGLVPGGDGGGLERPGGAGSISTNLGGSASGGGGGDNSSSSSTKGGDGGRVGTLVGGVGSASGAGGNGISPKARQFYGGTGGGGGGWRQKGGNGAAPGGGGGGGGCDGPGGDGARGVIHIIAFYE